MPRIWHENKTVEWRTTAEDEAKVKVGLQELLDANPGYTPVLIVEDASGEETTYTSLSASTSRGRGRRGESAVTEEPAPEEPEEETTSE